MTIFAIFGNESVLRREKTSSGETSSVQAVTKGFFANIKARLFDNKDVKRIKVDKTELQLSLEAESMARIGGAARWLLSIPPQETIERLSLTLRCALTSEITGAAKNRNEALELLIDHDFAQIRKGGSRMSTFVRLRKEDPSLDCKTVEERWVVLKQDHPAQLKAEIRKFYENLIGAHSVFSLSSTTFIPNMRNNV